MNSPLKSNRGSHEKATSKEVVFSVKFALRRVKLLRSDIRLTPSDIALRAAIGEFNIAFCDSRKYRNPEGIISHFEIAKYYTKYKFQGTEAGVFFAFSFSIEKFNFL